MKLRLRWASLRWLLLPMLAIGGGLALLIVCVGHNATATPSCSATWIGPAGGDFGTAANWSTDSVPGPGDWVCENAGDSISVNSSAAVLGGTLQGMLSVVSGGSFSVSSSTDATTITTLTLAGGTLGGTGSGSIELSGSGSSQSTWTGGSITGSGRITVATGAR